MSTTKPRITITLKPHAYEVVRRLAAMGGESMSKIVGDMLDVAIPSLERIVVVMEQAASMSEEARQGMRASFARADADVLPQLAASMKQLDVFIDGMATAAEAAANDTGERPMGAGEGAPEATARTAPMVAEGTQNEGSTPVSVTRGSGTDSVRNAGARKGKGERRSGGRNAVT